MEWQRIVTSHLSDLLSTIPLTAIKRLYKKGNEIKIGNIPDKLLDDKELSTIDNKIKLNKGHFLFSRCWLLVEGETDFIIMSGLFDHIKYYPDEHNFSILEISQITKKEFLSSKLPKHWELNGLL
jgi:putative ATP-dependent endonuclease of OLD family